MEPRIVFMGTPEFALPSLERLTAQYPVVGVVTQPDRRAGRGRHLTAPPVKEAAEAEGIPVFQPKRLRTPEAVERLREWDPDLIVVVAFGQFLPKEVLEMPRFGVVNLHPSLLPRWRGAAPIEAAIMEGDEVTGVTVMLLDEGMDTGPTLAQREVAIGSQETAGELEGRLAHEGADLLVETLPEYLTGRLQPCPQPEEGVTVVHRLKKEDAHIDWGRPAASLACQIRAFSPQVGAYTFWDGRRLKIFLAQPLEGADVPAARPGTVFEWQGCPAVVTGEGALVLLQLQMAGKRPMKGEVFMRGYRAMVGDELGPREAG